MIATFDTLKPVALKSEPKPKRKYVKRGAYAKRDASVLIDSRPPKRQRESNDSLFRRLKLYLSQLQKIDRSLPRDVWKRFISAYSQHWLYSINHGETATAPAIYYSEWAEIQAKGSIPMDTDASQFHSARNYHVYESPRETARRILGFED